MAPCMGRKKKEKKDIPEHYSTWPPASLPTITVGTMQLYAQSPQFDRGNNTNMSKGRVPAKLL